MQKKKIIKEDLVPDWDEVSACVEFLLNQWLYVFWNFVNLEEFKLKKLNNVWIISMVKFLVIQLKLKIWYFLWRQCYA